MSLLEKLTKKKPAADSISAAAQLDLDLDKAIGNALARGLHVHALISALESREQSARFRMAAGLRF